MKRFIIHAGMPKTGSSSIQASLQGLDRNGFAYVPSDTANHAPLFELLTSSTPESFRYFRKRGVDTASVQAQIKSAHDSFSSFLNERDGTVVFSSEHLGNMSQDSARHVAQLTQFRNMVQTKGYEIEVILYARAPHSRIESGFQQRVKAHDQSDFNLAEIWPEYRKHIELLDECFGKSAVTVVPFAPWAFPDKNVVKDFAQRIGLDLPESAIKRKNESLSAEAVALLYLHNAAGNKFLPSEKAHKTTRKWIAELSKFGSTKLRFADALITPLIEANRADLAWVEDRMGCALEERRSADGFEIASEDALIRLGMQQLPKIEALLCEKLDTLEAPRRRKMVQLLEALRAVC